MPSIILENARIFDGFSADCAEGMSVVIEDGLIADVSDRRVAAPGARRIDLAGRTLMPGLIDLHIHAYACHVDFHKVDLWGPTYRTAHAARMLGHALDCGFTTVRDIGGGDLGLARSIGDGLIRAPRFFYAGKILSMTGGHGDMRLGEESAHSEGYCSCGGSNSIAVMADGVPECLKAVREQLRRGAHCIKIMGSGGISSPTDPIWMNQYREDEVRAIVNECAERRTYVSAHCHPASAIRRSVEFGVRCIEHGTLIDAETARFVAEAGAFIVPTLVVIWTLAKSGSELDFPPALQEKANYAYSQAMAGLDIMRSAGVKVGFGTDLLGQTYRRQTHELTIRSEVFSPLEILRQATSNSAEVLMAGGKLGCVTPGAFADLIVVDGDPLKDISLLAQDGHKLDVIVRGGELIKNTLN